MNIGAECTFVKDMLKGDDCYELRLKLVEMREEKYPLKEED